MCQLHNSNFSLAKVHFFHFIVTEMVEYDVNMADPTFDTM